MYNILISIHKLLGDIRIEVWDATAGGARTPTEAQRRIEAAGRVVEAVRWQRLSLIGETRQQAKLQRGWHAKRAMGSVWDATASGARTPTDAQRRIEAAGQAATRMACEACMGFP